MFVPWPHSGLMAEVGRIIMGVLFLGDMGLVLWLLWTLRTLMALLNLHPRCFPWPVSPLCSRESDSHGGLAALPSPCLRHCR